MGKGEKTSEDESDEGTTSAEEIADKEAIPEKEEEEKPNLSDESEKKDKENDEESEDTEKNKDDLRKVIKLDSTEEEKEDKALNQKEPTEDSAEPTTREGLEQKRAILQSIKDFDFLIKKNQEDINELNQKLDSMTKDLDDLVSLYEIVSEQMNPFVGLSKVTKKRIDALENFTKEIEDLKERTGELESFAERSGAKLKSIGEGDKSHVKTIDTDAILGEENEITVDTESSGGLSDGEIQQPVTPENISIEDKEGNIPVEKSDEEMHHSITVRTINNNILEGLSDNELDIILEKAVGSFSPEETVDMVIDEYIERLKGYNVN